MWFLAQLRQPTRPLYSNLKETAFTKFFGELPSEKKKNLLEREVAGSKMIVPKWAHCQLRKEALKLLRAEGHAIAKALWSAYNNPHHRIEHGLTLLTVANSRASSMKASDQRLQRIEKISPTPKGHCNDQDLRT